MKLKMLKTTMNSDSLFLYKTQILMEDLMQSLFQLIATVYDYKLEYVLSLKQKKPSINQINENWN